MSYHFHRFDVKLGRKLAVLLNLLKINYVRLFNRVEQYQPLVLADRYKGWVYRSGFSVRSDPARLKFVQDKILEANDGGLHVDIGSQLGYLPLSLARQGLTAIGIELQYYAVVVSKALAELNDCPNAIFLNINVENEYELTPRSDTLTALSVFHHVVAEIANPEQSTQVIERILAKVKRRVIIEVADVSEGEYLWVEQNAQLFGGVPGDSWFERKLMDCGFRIVDRARFKTHLGGERSLLVADRENAGDVSRSAHH
jgi:hypothetical protein